MSVQSKCKSNNPITGHLSQCEFDGSVVPNWLWSEENVVDAPQVVAVEVTNNEADFSESAVFFMLVDTRVESIVPQTEFSRGGKISQSLVSI